MRPYIGESVRGWAQPFSVERVPPQLWFVASAVFHYLGPAFAVLLFAQVPVPGVAWLRIASAGVVFALWRRPWRRVAAMGRDSQRLVVALGLVLAAMNYSFYRAIDALPLGTVAALEFIGPILLALIGARTVRNLCALGVAVAGVWLLTDIAVVADGAAYAWAAANAGLFSAYIVIAHRLARSDTSTLVVDRLGLAMIVAVIAISPAGLSDASSALRDPVVLTAGFGVGVCSSVLPYLFDQLAMTRLDRPTYALFVALLPASAVVIGVVVLGQIPTVTELTAVALIVTGTAVHRGAHSSSQPIGRARSGAEPPEEARRHRPRPGRQENP